MDSITQFSLGAAIGIAVSPKKTAKIALISGLLATIPDLDIFLKYADPLTSVINHRGFSHSLFYLSLIAPLVAFFLHKVFGLISYSKWLILAFLTLVTHPILDSFTIYGTSLLLPFSDSKIMIGSIFIIDPIYTIPLVVSVFYLFFKRKLLFIKKVSFNTIALFFSQFYLLFTFAMQQLIVPDGKAFATPTPFNSFIWRVVIIEDDIIRQYFVDIFGRKGVDTTIAKNHQLKKIAPDLVSKYSNFSSEFYNLKIENNQLILQDLRMGTIANPAFSFVIATFSDNTWKTVKPYRGERIFNTDEMFGDKLL